MKNTFAVTMTLLLALTLGGSYAGYRLATAEREEHSAETASTASETAPSPNSAATGAAGASGTTGDVTAENQGGTQAGENGAVIAAGSESGGENPPSETSAPGGAATGGQTGQQPAETAANAEPTGDAKAGETVFASNCAGCHGAQAGGGVGPALTGADGPKAWTDAEFVVSLREGKTPQRELNAIMPRFTPEQLSDGDIANIHAWVKSLN